MDELKVLLSLNITNKSQLYKRTISCEYHKIIEQCSFSLANKFIDDKSQLDIMLRSSCESDEEEINNTENEDLELGTKKKLYFK